MRRKEETLAETKQGEPEAISINIGNVCDGAAIDAFDLALRKVLENIADLSTVATASRAIVMEFVFKPESDRCKVHIELAVKEKLCGVEKQLSKLFVARTEGGHLVALDADPRQMPLWEAPKPKEVPVIKFKDA